MKILHVCASWRENNGAANIARLIMREQEKAGEQVSFTTWASPLALRTADEVWIHCSWLPCLWWAALWGRNVHWMPEACYDPVRLRYHGWKKLLVGPIECFCLRRAKVLVATCEAEKGWVQSYLGKRCPHVEVTDVKRFFKLQGTVNRKQGTEKALHLLYLGRRHPLKGLEYLEEALKRISSVPCSLLPVTSQLKVVSNAFGAEKEAVWDWCDVLVLPTLSENFGLVVAEALEREKRVITTDGAPAWEPKESESVEVWKCGNMEIRKCRNGEMLYLKGYRDGTDDERTTLLKRAIWAFAK